jgi:hypothetical protein
MGLNASTGKISPAIPVDEPDAGLCEGERLTE